MTGSLRRLGERERQPWLRKLDRATAAHEKSRRQLDELIADARAAGVPLIAIAEHTPYSREWARKIADEVDAERAANAPEDGDSPSST
ncbi:MULTISPECIES: DUF3783 domain-containing protein [Streptomyces]|uniref:DUF3783 domain-containing protein n=1 Tax=Streptomyces TaxID=1883 RepID=UPI000B225B80|nr:MULTISPECIES: DUF3783 domain-containing protein [Streptomyces]